MLSCTMAVDLDPDQVQLSWKQVNKPSCEVMKCALCYEKILTCEQDKSNVYKVLSTVNVHSKVIGTRVDRRLYSYEVVNQYL